MSDRKYEGIQHSDKKVIESNIVFDPTIIR